MGIHNRGRARVTRPTVGCSFVNIVVPGFLPIHPPMSAMRGGLSCYRPLRLLHFLHFPLPLSTPTPCHLAILVNRNSFYQNELFFQVFQGLVVKGKLSFEHPIGYLPRALAQHPGAAALPFWSATPAAALWLTIAARNTRRAPRGATVAPYPTALQRQKFSENPR